MEPHDRRLQPRLRKSLSSPTVPCHTQARVAPARRSLRAPFGRLPEPNRCLRRHENPRLSLIPTGLLTARVYRAASSLTALSRTQQPQKLYRTVNQSIPEVADDSRPRGDNALNAIGPDVRFIWTSTSPLEGSPSSKAESTPEALHRARPQPRSPFIEGKSGDGVRASFCNDIRGEACHF